VPQAETGPTLVVADVPRHLTHADILHEPSRHLGVAVAI
jgi:hypothetical protein